MEVARAVLRQGKADAHTHLLPFPHNPLIEPQGAATFLSPSNPLMENGKAEGSTSERIAWPVAGQGGV